MNVVYSSLRKEVLEKVQLTKEFIRKASHPHPCPLPSRERGLKNCPSLDGRGLRGGCLNVALLMVVLVNPVVRYVIASQTNQARHYWRDCRAPFRCSQ